MATGKEIRKLHIGENDHLLAATYILNGDNLKTWSDIESLVTAGFTIETPWTKSDYESTAAPTAAKLATVPAVTVYYNNGASSATGTLAASGAETKKHIYLIYHPHQGGKDSYDEYVSTNSNDWEKIGNTDIDLSNYVTKGTYNTSGPSTNATGSTSVSGTAASAGAQTATGTATVTYLKHAANTGSTGTDTSGTTGTTSGGTVDFSNASFTGTTATISGSVSGISVDDHAAATLTVSGSQSIAAHSHTVNAATGTFNNVTSIKSDGAHTHSVSGVHAHTGTVAVSTVSFKQGTDSFSKGSLPALTVSNKTAVTGATVDANGVLSFTTATVGSASGWSAGTLPSFTQGTDTFSASTVTVAEVVANGTLTAASAGAHTHGVNTATITYVTGATLGTAGAVTVSGSNFKAALPALTHSVSGGAFSASYQPAGTISGSQTLTAHSHSYSALTKAHTHTIGDVTTTITAPVSVAVSSHTHSVSCGSHTHTLSSHTHSVTL